MTNKCICTQLTALEPTVNPDCPIHGALNRVTTSQEKDRFICKKMGVCWHEYVWVDYPDAPQCSYWECSGCKHKTQYKKYWKDNPDFTSKAGRVQLLKLIKTSGLGTLTLIGLIEYMRNDTGKFRDAVFKWLGGE